MSIRALRQAVTGNLTERRLSTLAVDLGIFDARSLTVDKLTAKFHRSNQFDDNTMLHFVTLNELRTIASSVGLNPVGINKKNLITELLKSRSSSGKKPIQDGSASSARAPEPAPEPEPDPEPEITSQFSPDGVPPNLYGTRHMLLYRDRDYWYLSSKKGGIIKVLSSKEEAQAWHKAFDEYRGFPHDPAVLRTPTGHTSSTP